MGKIFRVKIKISKEQNKLLEKFSTVYRTFYNKTLEVQLKNTSCVSNREEQFMSLEDIDIEVNNLNLKFPFKFDKGIRASALIRAQKVFYIWWDSYLLNSNKPSVGKIPRFISKIKELPFFSTITHVNVDKNGIYVPKIGYVKIIEKDYVPFGEYKNIKFKMIGSYWEVQLEANFDIEIEKVKPVIDSIEVLVCEDGSLQVGDIEFPSIMEFEPYLKNLKNFEKCKRKFKKIKYYGIDINKGKLEKLRSRINVLENKIVKMREMYFNSIANKLIDAKPAELVLSSSSTYKGNPQKFSSRSHIKSKTVIFLRIIKNKAELHGIKVVLENISSDIFKSKKLILKV